VSISRLVHGRPTLGDDELEQVGWLVFASDAGLCPVQVPVQHASCLLDVYGHFLRSEYWATRTPRHLAARMRTLNLSFRLTRSK